MIKDLDYYMRLQYPYETFIDEDGAVTVSHPDLPGCYSFAESGVEVALENLDAVRVMWIDGRLRANLDIPEPT